MGHDPKAHVEHQILNRKVPTGIAKEILDVLNDPPVLYDYGSIGCSCTNCKRFSEETGDITCGTCGYEGLLVGVECACYDYSCPGRVGGVKGVWQNGAGCFHGGLMCPVCDGGEAEIDWWQMMKNIRKIVNEHT